MNTEITINGNTNSMENFVTWTPSSGKVRLLNPGGIAGPVKVRLQNQTPGGRQLRFGKARSGPGQDTLELDLPVNGDPVRFFVAGKFDLNQVSVYDAMMEVAEVSSGNTLSVTPVFVRVRRNANDLQPAERDLVLSTFQRLNQSGSYQTFRGVHVKDADGEAHGFPGFLPWHRSYLLDLEREMQKLEPRFALPYWRFDETASTLLSPDFMGGANAIGSVVFSPSNPLADWPVDGGIGIRRRARFKVATQPAFVLNESQTLGLGEPGQIFSQFRRMSGQPHGSAHTSFIGDLDNTGTAAKDPLFFLLHCNVDRLWALWQSLHDRWDGTQNSVYSMDGAVSDRIGHRLNDTMWPWNKSTTFPRPSFPAPGGDFPPSAVFTAPGLTPKIRDMIDYQGVLKAANCLGFDYDVVPFDW